MSIVLTISNQERRTRLADRQALGRHVTNPLDAVRSVVGLHSSDPSTVYLSIWARAPEVAPTEISNALYEDRSLLRVYGMRRTLWVVDLETHPVVEHSSTVQIAPGERRRMEKMLEDGGVTQDGATWLRNVADQAERTIAEAGPILARDLTKQIPELTEKLTFHNKKGTLIGTVGVSTRTLVQLALESRIIRAEPVGSWISSQYRWSGMESWIGGPIPDMDPDAARADLLRMWLARFGPGTETDMKWWTGWTVKRTRKAIADIGAAEVGLAGGVGYVNADDLEPSPTQEPWIALLPSLDPTTMGWKERDWYLGDDASSRLFDRNGNAGPTVWANGRIVGGWAQRADGEVEYELFEDIGSEAGRAVADRAAALTAWIGELRVTPRFRSPHDKELTG
ncbi:MAG: winged helix DNA-binding domain-containing protein [Actinomycetota bacterium]|nr:winged helix DNA-binding domain-containing protein [Actinomycetota bacterium]